MCAICFTCVYVSCLCSENGLQLTFIYYIALSIGFIHTVYAAKASLSDKSSFDGANIWIGIAGTHHASY